MTTPNRPMEVPLEWDQTCTYVRKIDGHWWVAWCPLVDTTYVMAQTAGIVWQDWWLWMKAPNHTEALAFAITFAHTQTSIA